MFAVGGRSFSSYNVSTITSLKFSGVRQPALRLLHTIGLRGTVIGSGAATAGMYRFGKCGQRGEHYPRGNLLGVRQ